MKHVSILIPNGHTSLVNIAGTHQIFNQINGVVKQMGKDPVFEVQLVGLTKEAKQDTGLFTVYPNCTIEDVEKTDLIIIPAIHIDQKEGIERNRDFVPWTIGQYKNGAELASFCIWAYLLAAEVAFSRRSLERRFKKATSNTLVEYIQQAKVQ